MSEDTAERVQERWLSPGVKGIGAASLLSDMGHEVPTPLLPRLLTGTLGAPAAALGFKRESQTPWPVLAVSPVEFLPTMFIAADR
jgi:hypothetical protein